MVLKEILQRAAATVGFLSLVLTKTTPRSIRGSRHSKTESLFLSQIVPGSFFLAVFFDFLSKAIASFSSRAFVFGGVSVL